MIELTDEMVSAFMRAAHGEPVYIAGREVPNARAGLAAVLAIVERGLRVPDAYVHVECGTVTTWNAAMVAEYGPIGEQGCDCENAWSLNWRPLYAGPPEPSS